MSDDDRLARLEHRLTVLEGLVRQLVTANPGVRPVPPPPPPPPPPPLPSRPAAEPPSRPAPESPSRRAAEPSIISEEWLGQRGLLAVGVIFVILAAGYLLKLSFERGWISPLARCVGGALAGGAVGALGWRLHGKGTRSYGAALIGLGAAIIYLAVWAAARLYQFLPPTPAIGALAAVAVTDALKLLVGQGPPATESSAWLLRVDLWHGLFERIRVERDPVCPTCAGRYDYLQSEGS